MENKMLIEAINKAKLVFQMFHIILCDDDAGYLKILRGRVSGFMQHNNMRAKIHTFTKMDEISNQLMKLCDIAILDIDFKGETYSGIDIARRLRTFRNDSVIVFVTNFIEYAPEGYEVQAFRYIMKQDIPKKLEIILDQAFKHLNADSENIRFQINGEVVDIPLHQILYIEAQLHTVKVFIIPPKKCGIREYSFYGSIGRLEQYLCDKGFLRIHKSYLVNAAHVKRYQCHSIELTSGVVLNASASRYAEQKAKYLLWRGHIINE